MAPLFALPNALILSTLAAEFPCREAQIRSLATLLAIRGALSRNIVLYGLEATGKSTVARALLEELSSDHRQELTNGDTENTSDTLRYAIIKSAECISGRHLLEQTVGSVAKAVDWEGNVGRGENLAQLVVEIGKMVESWTSEEYDGKRRLVLVFDGIDRQRDAPPTLLPALARLGEIIPNLTTIYITTSPRPNFLHLPGVPHIHFPPYSKAELITILGQAKPSPMLPSGESDTTYVWTRFLPTVYDSFTKHSSRDILSFRALSLRLWPQFIKSILDGQLSPSPYSKLFLANRSLFQNDSALLPSIISTLSLAAPQTQVQKQKDTHTLASQLPHTSRFLLLSSYLASLNPAKTDIHHFSKATTSKRKKRGGGTALTSSTPGVSKNRKISRKLLGPQAFVLERMLAIFHCIRTDAGIIKGQGKGPRQGDFEEVNGSADIGMAIATLASLRLLVKMGASGAGDALDGNVRYKVAVGWEVARALGRSVGVELEDYVAD
ncbi:origin recognition complex subunit 5 C-terminus-domain-containing protein [Halenospora varia]|nr:origin recognition complex subunit 5 C-terminus-domain-containing protein [Halenospora varia]